MCKVYLGCQLARQKPRAEDAHAALEQGVGVLLKGWACTRIGSHVTLGDHDLQDWAVALVLP